MAKYSAILALSALCALALGGLASAAPYCPTSENFFGTVERINGNMLTVQTPSGHWADVRIENGARLNENGTTLHVGSYVGASGCVERSGVFDASSLTVANRAYGYNESLAGTVLRISGPRVLVQQTGHGNGWWYVPDVDELHVGENVTAAGMIGANGVYYPSQINGRSVAYDADESSLRTPSTITLTGVVQSVSGNTIHVYEPAYHTTGVWVVGNAARFRTGQRVSATGTENRHGLFYPRSVTIL